jgi:hypothetical protein
MTVPFPVPEWPAVLLEQGPPDDRSILLRGDVAIGSARFELTAMRIDPIRFGPDFRADLNWSIYADYQLPTLLDLVSELIGVSEPSTLGLGAGRYVLWKLPVGEDS